MYRVSRWPSPGITSRMRSLKCASGCVRCGSSIHLCSIIGTCIFPVEYWNRKYNIQYGVHILHGFMVLWSKFMGFLITEAYSLFWMKHIYSMSLSFSIIESGWCVLKQTIILPDSKDHLDRKRPAFKKCTAHHVVNPVLTDLVFLNHLDF